MSSLISGMIYKKKSAEFFNSIVLYRFSSGINKANRNIISERLRIKEIITIDSDYYIYRTIKKEMIKNIFDYKN